MIYGSYPVTKAHLFLQEEQVNDWFDTSMCYSFEDLEGTHSRDAGQ